MKLWIEIWQKSLARRDTQSLQTADSRLGTEEITNALLRSEMVMREREREFGNQTLGRIQRDKKQEKQSKKKKKNSNSETPIFQDF